MEDEPKYDDILRLRDFLRKFPLPAKSVDPGLIVRECLAWAKHVCPGDPEAALDAIGTELNVAYGAEAGWPLWLDVWSELASPAEQGEVERNGKRTVPGPAPWMDTHTRVVHILLKVEKATGSWGKNMPRVAQEMDADGGDALLLPSGFKSWAEYQAVHPRRFRSRLAHAYNQIKRHTPPPDPS